MAFNFTSRNIEGTIELNKVQLVDADIETNGSDSVSRERAYTFSPPLFNNSPTILAWKDLTVAVNVKTQRKVLLNSINGTITGGFWAIMGGSGSGKTTLLSTLSLRLDR